MFTEVLNLPFPKGKTTGTGSHVRNNILSRDTNIGFQRAAAYRGLSTSEKSVSSIARVKAPAPRSHINVSSQTDAALSASPPSCMNHPTPSTTSKRKQVVDEIIKTEKDYIDHINIIISVCSSTDTACTRRCPFEDKVGKSCSICTQSKIEERERVCERERQRQRIS